MHVLIVTYIGSIPSRPLKDYTRDRTFSFHSRRLSEPHFAGLLLATPEIGISLKAFHQGPHRLQVFPQEPSFCCHQVPSNTETRHHHSTNSALSTRTYGKGSEMWSNGPASHARLLMKDGGPEVSLLMVQSLAGWLPPQCWQTCL